MLIQMLDFATVQYYIPKKHIFYFILKETSKYNLSTLYHSHYMLQTSTIRKLSILFVFTPSIENSMFPRRAIFAISFCVLHSSPNTSTIKKNSQSDTISLLNLSLSERNMFSHINVMVALKDNMKVQQRRNMFFR